MSPKFPVTDDIDDIAYDLMFCKMINQSVVVMSRLERIDNNGDGNDSM